MIKEFTNSNYRVLKTLYDNQVDELGQKMIRLSQMKFARQMGFSKNTVYYVFKFLRDENYLIQVGYGKYKLSPKALYLIESMERIQKKMDKMDMADV